MGFHCGRPPANGLYNDACAYQVYLRLAPRIALLSTNDWSNNMSDSTGTLPKGIQLTPFDPAYQGDPYGVLQAVRNRAPVLDDDQFNRWFITRFDDVRAVLRDKDMR